MPDEHKHGHKHDHGHGHSDDHEHGNDDEHAQRLQHGPDEKHDHSHDHGHEHVHDHEHGHSDDHGHSHDHKTRFHDPQHAAEFDRRSTMEGIRGSLTTKMIEMLSLSGNEWVLDVATGTGRVARPVSKHMKTGHIIGVDQALAMLDVGHQHKEPISSYSQSAGAADALPFKSNSFDRAFVSFSLHHFGNASGVVKEVMRVLKGGGRFVVLDPIIEEAKDAVDAALEAKINQVFRRTHGPDFRFHTASSIQRLLTKAGYRIPRTNILSFRSIRKEWTESRRDGIGWRRRWNWIRKRRSSRGG
jgi:ubiquinone/menaquinone biosynthesis C-methylase UbiE